MNETITARLLKEMVTAGVVRDCQLIGTHEGFVLVAKVGMVERTLRVANDQRVRLFQDPGKALKYIRQELNIGSVTVNLANARF